MDVVMAADILKGILIVVIGVPAVAVIWGIGGTIARSASYLAQGSLMTVVSAILYYVFSTSSWWSNPKVRVFLGVLIAVAYAVGFLAAYRNKAERQLQGVTSNE